MTKGEVLLTINQIKNRIDECRKMFDFEMVKELEKDLEQIERGCNL